MVAVAFGCGCFLFFFSFSNGSPRSVTTLDWLRDIISFLGNKIDYYRIIIPFFFFFPLLRSSGNRNQYRFLFCYRSCRVNLIDWGRGEETFWGGGLILISLNLLILWGILRNLELVGSFQDILLGWPRRVPIWWARKHPAADENGGLACFKDPKAKRWNGLHCLRTSKRRSG